MIDSRDSQSIAAAKLYYEQGLGQSEVAAELGVSRPTVSKLLQAARDKGYVSITIHDPRERADELIDGFVERWGLEEVRMVRPVRGSNADVLSELGRSGASLLEELVHDDMSVGISWGDTMYAVAKHLRPLSVRGVRVVQLKGGHSHSERSTHDIATLTRFARSFDAAVEALPLPVILDSKETKDLVVQDRHIAAVLQAGASTDMAVFTVGGVGRHSLLVNLGMLAPDEEKQIMAHAVGDVCSRFFTAEGEVASPEVDQRTVGISLADLKARPIRVLVAGGADKVEAIRVALTMGMATHLVIDHETAARVYG